MPIRVKRNTAYGPPNVTDKYSPFLNIAMETGNKAIHSGLLENRYTLLRSSGLFPQTLNLILPNWGTATANQLGAKAPLVVISTNRANWIKAGYDAGLLQPATDRPFENASDVRALTATRGQTVSPPIYCPYRIGTAAAARSVFILVHAHEYTHYKRTLAGTGMTVVGWEFQLPRANRAPRGVWLCGFGASRFAALQFCKELRRRALAAAATRTPRGTTWKYAWLIDDNVVALTSFVGYDAIETRMNVREVACAGFKGESAVRSFETNKAWATEANRRPWGRQGTDLGTIGNKGIVQQAAVWNIDYLTTNHLNVAPFYITSAEDISLASYFDYEQTPYLYFGSMRVFKEDPTPDNSQGAKEVMLARQRLVAWFTAMEAANPPASTAPPPLYVSSDDEGDDREDHILANYIVNKVLPNASDEIKEKKNDVNTQNTAKCQGVEQITAEAIGAAAPDPATGKPRTDLIADTALTHAFKINGTVAHPVNGVDKP
jgi:hypothetical protein